MKKGDRRRRKDESIWITNRQRRVTIDTGFLRESAASILSLAGVPGVALSLLLVNNARMQEINHQYRGENHPTDVLSFLLMDTSLPSPLLGDVVISVEWANREAERRERPVEEEVLFLLIHGVLHLTGYDHSRLSEARVMRKKEREIFKKVWRGRPL